MTVTNLFLNAFRAALTTAATTTAVTRFVLVSNLALRVRCFAVDVSRVVIIVVVCFDFNDFLFQFLFFVF